MSEIKIENKRLTKDEYISFLKRTGLGKPTRKI